LVTQAPRYERQVFLNVPFDLRYWRLMAWFRSNANRNDCSDGENQTHCLAWPSGLSILQSFGSFQSLTD